uniref:Protein kinase domain-containing protein n=1 Tax=viral metagenome TaxID=1070528 RepID=A0A6C0BCL8_9ZZZZ
MGTREPQIIRQNKIAKTKLFKVEVEYEYDDEENNSEYPDRETYIVKYLPLIDNGSRIMNINPVLCEAFINKNFKNPYLATAEHVCVKSGVIVLFFKEASGDFYTTRRRNFSIVKNWIICFLKGLAHLHLNRIIHGDPKAKNIIIYDDEAKLSDFGMSSLILGCGEQEYHKKMYTPTHRAPEVWTTNYWDLSADIWAAGCTIYEMLYGKSLFGVKNTESEYLLQLETWLDGNQNGTIEFTNEWNNPNFYDINMIILKMLNGVPKNRPTIFDILKEPFFNEPELVLSSSPTSNCSYGSLNVCPIIPHRIYDKSNIKNKTVLTKISRNLALQEPDKEIRMLVLCMYEAYSEDNYDPILLRTLLIIVHVLTHREKPLMFTITLLDKENILEYSKNVNFCYINWSKFYGVFDKFLLHLPRGYIK